MATGTAPAASGSDTNEPGPDEAAPKATLWASLKERYGSRELENKGSVARDHLALERTFLAWLRTSLSFASIGIAVSQLFRLNTSLPSDTPAAPGQRLYHVGKPLGATFIAIAILVLFLGFHRYFESQHYVVMGKFPASRGSVLLVTAITGTLIVGILVVVLTIAPSTIQSLGVGEVFTGGLLGMGMPL